MLPLNLFLRRRLIFLFLDWANDIGCLNRDFLSGRRRALFAMRFWAFASGFLFFILGNISSVWRYLVLIVN